MVFRWGSPGGNTGERLIMNTRLSEPLPVLSGKHEERQLLILMRLFVKLLVLITLFIFMMFISVRTFNRTAARPYEEL